MSQTNFSLTLVCFAEIKHSDYMFQVTRLFLTNQRALFLLISTKQTIWQHTRYCKNFYLSSIRNHNLSICVYPSLSTIQVAKLFIRSMIMDYDPSTVML